MAEAKAKPKCKQFVISEPKQPQTRSDADSFSYLSNVAICFLTINSLIAAVQSRYDPWTLSFVVSIYVLLILLFWCLRAYDRLPDDSEKRERLKIPIWSVATALNLVFAYRVAMIMNVALQCLVWAMAAISSLSGFYFFFIYHNKPNGEFSGSKPFEGHFVLDAKV